MNPWTAIILGLLCAVPLYFFWLVLGKACDLGDEMMAEAKRKKKLSIPEVPTKRRIV